MKKLNYYQERLLKAALVEEGLGQVRVNEGMQDETKILYEKAQAGDEIAFEALLDLLDFWSCYFAFGADEALAIRDKIQTETIEELNKKIIAYRLKLDEFVANGDISAEEAAALC